MAFAKDPEKRAILSWIGGGAVIVAGGVWTAVTFFIEHKDLKEANGASGIAIRQGLGAGGNLSVGGNVSLGASAEDIRQIQEPWEKQVEAQNAQIAAKDARIAELTNSGSESHAVLGLVQDLNQRISGLESKLKAQQAELDDYRRRFSSGDLALTDPGDVGRLQEIQRRLAPADPELGAIFSDPYDGLNKLEKEIAAQTQRVQALEKSKLPSATLDGETMKLKRLIDRRSQMFDMLRQIVDAYNRTANGIIDNMR
jgi:hypothetical protein